MEGLGGERGLTAMEGPSAGGEGGVLEGAVPGGPGVRPGAGCAVEQQLGSMVRRSGLGRVSGAGRQRVRRYDAAG